MNYLYALPFLVMFFCNLGHAIEPGTVTLNNQGIEKLEKKEPYFAYNLFLESLSRDPFNPWIHLNLGLAFEINKEYDKAYNEYKTAYRYAQTTEERFIALFNAGNAAAAQKKIELALENYQKALEIKADSKEAKTNIELLWQGGGGEGGQNQDNKQDSDSQNQDPNQGGSPQQEPPKPQTFEGKNLSKDDVRKILEEIKNQEQKIRAKEYEKGRKEAPKDKDW